VAEYKRVVSKVFSQKATKKPCMNGGTCKLHVFHECEQRDKRVGR
jgi:hypothetical protein